MFKTSKPRMVLLTSPSLYGAEIIRTLSEASGIELVGIGLTNRAYKGKGPIAALTTSIRRTGLRYTWYSILISNLAWTLLRLRSRPRALNAKHDGVRYLKDVNAFESRSWLEQLAPDYVVSFFFNQWIGRDVRSIPKTACLNVHPSLLPALRGPDPVFRALERGLTETGITIHHVADAFDAGEIVFQTKRAIPKECSELELYLTLVRDGTRLLVEWLEGRISCSAERLQPSPPSSDDYHTFPDSQEVRAFHRNGHYLITLVELFRAIGSIL